VKGFIYLIIVDDVIAIETGNSRNFVYQGLGEKRVRYWEFGRKGCDSVSDSYLLSLSFGISNVLKSHRGKRLCVSQKKNALQTLLSVHDFFVRHKFSFKCHRRDLVPNSKDQSLIYAINDISYHPVHGTVSTCASLSYPTLPPGNVPLIYIYIGSDGTVHFWDTDARTRLKVSAPTPLFRFKLFNATCT